MSAWFKKPTLELGLAAWKACRWRLVSLHVAFLIKQIFSEFQFRSPLTAELWHAVNLLICLFMLQAVMASDFSLPQFRFLERLLIVHGHWCYKRISKMVLICPNYTLEDQCQWTFISDVLHLFNRSFTSYTRILCSAWRYSTTSSTHRSPARYCMTIGTWRHSMSCWHRCQSYPWEFLSRTFHQMCVIR